MAVLKFMKKYWYLLVLVVLLAFASTQCSFKVSPSKEKKMFLGAPYQPQHRFLSNQYGKIHYVITGDTSKQALIFVHGSPGGWEDYAKYMRDSALLQFYCVVSVDRPGFGESDYGKPMITLAEQSTLVGLVVKATGKDKPVVLVGHSYGGPLVARVNMDFPESIEHLVLLAAAIDPAMEEKEWFRPVARALSFMLPGALNASNEELAHLKQDLDVMMPLWPKIKNQVTMIHGTKDVLVPYANTAFAINHIPANQLKLITLEKVNHFIPWSHFEVVRNTLIRIAAKE